MMRKLTFDSRGTDLRLKTKKNGHNNHTKNTNTNDSRKLEESLPVPISSTYPTPQRRGYIHFVMYNADRIMYLPNDEPGSATKARTHHVLFEDNSAENNNS